MYKINVNKTKCYFYQLPECNITILQAAKVCLNPGIANNIFCLNYAHDHDITIIYPYRNKHIIPLALHNMKVALYKLGA